MIKMSGTDYNVESRNVLRSLKDYNPGFNDPDKGNFEFEGDLFERGSYFNQSMAKRWSFNSGAAKYPVDEDTSLDLSSGDRGYLDSARMLRLKGLDSLMGRNNSYKQVNSVSPGLGYSESRVFLKADFIEGAIH